MRRLMVVMLSAIALLALGSIAAIAWLTRLDSGGTTAIGSGSAAEPEAPPVPPALPVAPPADAVPPPAPPPGVTVEIEKGVTGVVPPEPPPPRVTPPPVDPARTSEALRARIRARCGGLTVRYVEGDAGAASGGEEAILVLQLETLTGEVKVVDSVVHSPGRTRPALVSCAQWALRGAQLPAAGVTAGKRMQALLLVGSGSPRRASPAEEER